MHSRFDTEARIAVAQATDIARELGHREVGPDHLLLGLLANMRGRRTPPSPTTVCGSTPPETSWPTTTSPPTTTPTTTPTRRTSPTVSTTTATPSVRSGSISTASARPSGRTSGPT